MCLFPQDSLIHELIGGIVFKHRGFLCLCFMANLGFQHQFLFDITCPMSSQGIIVVQNIYMMWSIQQTGDHWMLSCYLPQSVSSLSSAPCGRHYTNSNFSISEWDANEQLFLCNRLKNSCIIWEFNHMVSRITAYYTRLHSLDSETAQLSAIC